MKTSHFYRASAIRQQKRAGRSVADLATTFCVSEIVVENIIAARTREGAAKVLDDLSSFDVVSRFVLVNGSIVDFTNLIQSGYEQE